MSCQDTHKLSQIVRDQTSFRAELTSTVKDFRKVDLPIHEIQNRVFDLVKVRVVQCQRILDNPATGIVWDRHKVVAF